MLPDQNTCQCHHGRILHSPLVLVNVYNSRLLCTLTAHLKFPLAYTLYMHCPRLVLNLSLLPFPSTLGNGIANGAPESVHCPSLQQRSNPSPVKQGIVNIIPRPRPSSLRSRLDPWQAIPQRRKSSPFESDSSERDRGSTVNSLTDTDERTKSHMPSLLDIDVEGQNSDSTVPLCRLKSKACRPSIYELEREFLS